MNKMKWLIRRELWENKGSIVWAPAVVAGVLAGLATLAAFAGRQITIDGELPPSVAVEGGPRDHIVEALTQTYMASSIPLLLLLSVLVFFYCLGALYDERRDRSILFWKSLPVSDLETVLSKAAIALLVAPLITVAIGLALSLFILLVVCAVMAMHGTQVFVPVLLSPELYRSALIVVGALPVYVLWALPTVGWLLLVSSIVRSKVFLWAVGTPLVTSLLLQSAEKFFQLDFNTGWIVRNVVERILLGVMPGSWFLFTSAHNQVRLMLPDDGGFRVGGLLGASWQTLGTGSAWIGGAAGVAMLAGAVWIRRHREEG